ncbi:putative signal peptide protein [Puccinia sorghi]|uniref:Putative signal peptide protein n=1 Tax=Puccinia sorghi TaxID=27349 RepID=A0A0L6UGJ2_9BASI|nr:putative signal peptide protein [Puccinia sorghi]
MLRFSFSYYLSFLVCACAVCVPCRPPKKLKTMIINKQITSVNHNHCFSVVFPCLCFLFSRIGEWQRREEGLYNLGIDFFCSYLTKIDLLHNTSNCSQLLFHFHFFFFIFFSSVVMKYKKVKRKRTTKFECMIDNCLFISLAAATAALPCPAGVSLLSWPSFFPRFFNQLTQLTPLPLVIDGRDNGEFFSVNQLTCEANLKKCWSLCLSLIYNKGKSFSISNSLIFSQILCIDLVCGIFFLSLFLAQLPGHHLIKAHPGIQFMKINTLTKTLHSQYRYILFSHHLNESWALMQRKHLVIGMNSDELSDFFFGQTPIMPALNWLFRASQLIWNDGKKSILVDVK